MLFSYKKYRIIIWTLVGLSTLIISLFFMMLSPEKQLPVYQPKMVEVQLVDSSLRHIKRFHTISDFQMFNQNNQMITLTDYENKIFIVDFFFTTCPTICPVMTGNMVKLQNQFLDDQQIKFLSFSVTPEIDSVEQLKRYSVEKGVVDDKWNLVTGDRKEIFELARKSFLVVKTTDNPLEMVHTENFVLVDPEKRIRGFYDGTDSKNIKRLEKDIKILKREYKKSKS
ncbi:MAG: SCO family protein [Flavobacteriaceae bacterium]|nr:SCO family protein [Flavobacteriaceae bacterium]